MAQKVGRRVKLVEKVGRSEIYPPCSTPLFEIISNTDANFLNLHIDKATKTRGDKQLFNHIFYETNFKPKLFSANV